MPDLPDDPGALPTEQSSEEGSPIQAGRAADAPRLSPIAPEESAPPRPSIHTRHLPLAPSRPPDARHPQPTAHPPNNEADPAAALNRLRSQLAQVAHEFAEGRINRAQFYAIYNRYNEQRDIIERLLLRNPQSSAWQQVAQPGHTQFLRHHFEAQLLFYSLFALGELDPIVLHGSRRPAASDILPVLRALPGLLGQRGALRPAYRRTSDRKSWLVVVPGRYTVSLALYSLEPAAKQIERLADLHADFERANVHTLARGDLRQERMVFPQRALFRSG